MSGGLSGSMNSISDNTSTVFSGDFHVGEKSERLRESDFGVQIVPASRSPSELSAHQMGLSTGGYESIEGSEPIRLILSLLWLLENRHNCLFLIVRSCASTSHQINAR